MRSLQQILDDGWQWHQAGEVEKAESLYRQVLDLQPGHADAWVYIGIAQFDQRRFTESVTAYQEAIKSRHFYPIAWNNLGNSYRMLGEVDRADECFQTALDQQPEYLSAIKNRGTLWVWSGEIERGMRWYQRGLEINPDEAELHRNLGVIYLLLGDYDQGWPEYRWRWRMPEQARPVIPAPLWQGESLAGKSILLYPEQGRGDAIQFVRVAKAIRELGGRVILCCAEPMLALFSSTVKSLGVERLHVEDRPSPKCDYHASMIDVIDLLYQKTAEITWGSSLFDRGQGYLGVSDELERYWADWLESNMSGMKAGTLKVGINWQGNPDHSADIYRSIPLTALRPLVENEDVKLISLQFGRGIEQIENCGFSDHILRLPDHVDQDHAFTDTAAIVRNLDMVVTSDTSIAHLAGAVGTRVVTMLGRVPDWRWLNEGESTLWYPTMRLVRQQRLGCWEDVIHKVTSQIGWARD